MQSDLQTTSSMLPDETFDAICQRILDYAKACPQNARGLEDVTTAPRRQIVGTRTVTTGMILDMAAEWQLHYRIPDWVKADMQGWAGSFARALNSDAGWVVRKYWSEIPPELLMSCKVWPVLSDFHAAARAVANREGHA